MESAVDVAGHLHKRVQQDVRVLPCLVDLLLEADSGVTAVVKILLIHLSAIVFVHMPAMKHQGNRTAFVFLHARTHVDVKPVLEGLPHLLKIMKSLRR